jgi:hypothetical protein
MRYWLLIGLLFASFTQAMSLDSLSNKDTAEGLKEALSQGAGKAVDALGKTDGFLNNAQVHIPLPGNLKKAGKMLRTLGMGQQADDLETAMNRAAEAAVPEAKALLVNSVKQMSVSDAKGILTGGDDAATQYFRRTTSGPLAEKFKPIVNQAMSKVNVAQTYDRFAGKAAKFGLLKPEDAQLDSYVTQKALDGLYLMIAEEEKNIRKNPAEATGKLARTVFDALR